MNTVIDVSYWQGPINWSMVKSAGVWGAIIKAGGSDAGFYVDSKWEENYIGAINAGLNIGAYYFVGPGCKSYEDGATDAQRFIKMLAGKVFELPVYIDFEAPDATNKAGNTAACKGFCETMEKAGYYAGIYASDVSGFRERLNLSELQGRFSLWVARYGSAPAVVQGYGMWQYSSGRISGIAGNVDLNHCYQDFPNIIKNAGLNGYGDSFKPSTPAATKKSNEAIADEVIAGAWGNGDDRRSRLTSAGYDYSAIQAIVNRKLGQSAQPATAKKSNEAIADEVIAGAWGNGDDRRSRLTSAGYDYSAIQAIVNRKLGQSAQPTAQYCTVDRWPAKHSTLSGIAADYGTTAANIAALNGISVNATIYPGQKLRVK